MFAGIYIIRIFALVIFEILIIGDFYYGRNIRKKELGLAATHVIRPKNKVSLCQYGGSRKEEMEATPIQGWSVCIRKEYQKSPWVMIVYKYETSVSKNN